MKLLTVLAATATAATVAAALTIPAGADESPDATAVKIATCLRSHGADLAADADGLAVKTWAASHAEDPAVKACMPDAASPPELAACLRAHGLNPPANLFDLKPWVLQQRETDAGKAALHACGVDMRPPEKAVVDDAKFAACLRDHGAAVPAGAEGLALKTWLRDHGQEDGVVSALKACSGDDGGGDVKKAAICGGEPAPAAKPDASATPEQ
jgi:hypothetical protein